MATTFTILAVFVPVSFMSGMVGRFFYEFGITVAAAVVASLFVSFTLDPMLSSRWVDPDIERGYHPHFVGRTLARFNQWFEDLHVKYERLLGWCLRHRLAVLAIAVVAFLASFPILAILGGDFMPDFNRGEYQVTFKATPGATLAETKERALAVVRELKKLPDVDYTYTTIGEAGITRRGPTEGVVFVKLKSSRGKTFSRGPLRGAARGGGRPRPHLRLHRGRRLRPKPLQYSRARAGGGRARPPLPPADRRRWRRSRASSTSRRASRRASPSCASTSTATARATSASTSARSR